MDPILVIIMIFVAGLFFIIYFFNSKIKELKKSQLGNKDQENMFIIINELRKEIRQNQGENRKELESKLNLIRQTLDRGMDFSFKSIKNQFQESKRLIEQTSQRISRFEQTNQKIAGFAEQLQSLESFLKNPKQRGILGEYYLESILKNVFNPEQFELQYKFKDGSIVDAVIFYQDKILPIDSKFSMENYNKMIEEKDTLRKKNLEKNIINDIKKRINETAKYIKINEGTFDFAFMFIPSESVYYDLISAKVGIIRETKENIINYAHKKNVVLVSPSSFYAYLQTILHGLKLIQMKESMSVFRKNIDKLDRHLKNYENHFLKIGTHLTTTVNAYNNSSKEFKKIDKDLYKISQKPRKNFKELEKIEKPKENV
ncbi:MAG: DNA recombination protein RmuC [Candidatus Moranbacteria bacterium]|nr:DNA recombination protein RmuC [Candidatus Moranbacteria bacterium]